MAAAATSATAASEDFLDDDDEITELSVFTLNCWGMKFISKHRRERIEAIGKYLARGDHDIVLLQEVWVDSDYETIRQAVETTLPSAHYFLNGIGGSGTCIFSRTFIQDATFHEFALNGYPQKLWHGDWFVGKGLGVCQIDFKGFNIHIYTSHYHAEYDAGNDIYLGHRVIHALESASWIKLTSSAADLTIYAGDFNTEPTSVAYKLLRHTTPLEDCWAEAHGGPESGGQTSETPTNTFTTASALKTCPQGKRIDFVMYRTGPKTLAKTKKCELPLPQVVPNHGFSFSDHEGLSATLRLCKKRELGGGGASSAFPPPPSPPTFRRKLSLLCRPHAQPVIHDAIQVIRKSRKSSTAFPYTTFSVVIVILLVASFIPSFTLYYTDMQPAIEIVLFVPRCLLFVLFVFYLLMATLFQRREQHALEAAERSLLLMKDNCEAQTATPVR